jgi:hypothetical protein
VKSVDLIGGLFAAIGDLLATVLGILGGLPVVPGLPIG